VKRRAALVAFAALLTGSLAALAYIPSAASLVRRAAGRVSEGSKSKEATLSGWLWLGDKDAVGATLTLRFPLSCALQTGAGTASSNSREPGRPQLEDKGLGTDATDLLRLACPLLAYRGQSAPQAEQSLRQAALAAGVAPELAPTTLARLYDRVAIVLGAAARQLDRPQLWLYKDNGAPARLLARQGERLDDLRLLQYGNPAAGDWFPRVVELWRGNALVARFEALEVKGFQDSGPSEDDEGRE
jgi:hypothetical protein